MAVEKKTSEFVADFATKHEITKAEAKRRIDSVLEAIRETVADAEVDNLALSQFGQFKTIEVAARKGVNPRTKEAIEIPATTRVSFKPAKAFKDAVSGK